MSQKQLSEFFRSKLFAGIIVGVCIMLVVICIFEVGVIVGYHEAAFSAQWSENYDRNFGSGDQSNALGVGSIGLPDGHSPIPDGILGKIVSISPAVPAVTSGSAGNAGSNTATENTTLVISSNTQPEEKVLIDSDTIIRDRENTVGISDLQVGSYAVVLGTPNTQGEIEAKLIRIVPSPEELMATSSSQ